MRAVTIPIMWSPEVCAEPCPVCGGDLVRTWFGESTPSSVEAVYDGGTCQECGTGFEIDWGRSKP